MSLISRRDFTGAMAAAGAALAPIRAVLSQEKPATWVFTGDSITHGALHTMGARSYVEHFAERLRWEMRRPRDIVVNTGISGNRITNLVSDMEWRVLRFKPSVVSLMFGMNDCVAGPEGYGTFRNGMNDCLRNAAREWIAAAGAYTEHDLFSSRSHTARSSGIRADHPGNLPRTEGSVD